MRQYSAAAVAILVLSGVVLSAQPQSQTYVQDKWEISLFAGYDLLKDESAATAVQGLDSLRLVTLDYEASYIVGARITENLGSHLGAELEYSMANQPLSFLNLRPGLPRVDVSHRVHSLTYSILYYPLPRNACLRPYAAVGAGTAFYQLDGDSKAAAEIDGLALKDRFKLAGVFGGGVKYKVNDRIGVRFDFRDQLTGVPSYGLPKVSPSFQGNIGAGFNTDGVVTNLQFSAGILFYWGGF